MAINPNSRYPTQTNAPDANYPYGSARNVSVPGDGTGTPWEEDIVNDLFGWQQQLLDAAGITPSGNPDKKGVSQYYNAMRLTGGYPGLIVPMAINVDPATLGMRVLLLDGSGVLRSSYSDLDTAVYIGDSNNATAEGFFRADDAAGIVRNTAGNYLILGDFRGRFLRGIGSPDPSPSRLIGDLQGDAFQRHTHRLQKNDSNVNFHEIEFTGLSKGSGRVVPSLFEAGDTEDIAYAKTTYLLDQTTLAPVADETRPLNVAVNWGIWY